MRYIIIPLINLYQLVISPLLGKSCRFYPTCSQYALEAFKKYNFFKAFFYTVKRLVKCHPLNEGGNDPVP